MLFMLQISVPEVPKDAETDMNNMNIQHNRRSVSENNIVVILLWALRLPLYSGVWNSEEFRIIVNVAYIFYCVFDCMEDPLYFRFQ
jgi:hypothetical protein